MLTSVLKKANVFASSNPLTSKLPEIVILSPIVTSDVLFPIDIGTLLVSVPIFIPSVVSVESIVILSVESISIVVHPDNVVPPFPPN